MEIKITNIQQGIRIDKFLADTIGDTSRSQIKKIINAGDVFINGKISSAHYLLKEGDIIKIKKEKKSQIKTKKEEEIKTKEKDIDLDIIEDNKDFLIINKPTGLIVHGAPHIKAVSLIDVLLKKFPKIAKASEDPDRPGIVHRIDKDVSGLLVVAKHNISFEDIKKQFQKRKVLKKYVALVYGQISKDRDTINFPLKHSSDGHKMAALPKTFRGGAQEEGKNAITEFKTLKKFINYTLLEVKIKTGRTHQIRAHMSAYGHPIVGDNLYGTHKTKDKNKKLKTTRIFLAAVELGFKNLKGETQKFKIKLPPDFEKILKEIK